MFLKDDDSILRERACMLSRLCKTYSGYRPSECVLSDYSDRAEKDVPEVYSLLGTTLVGGVNYCVMKRFWILIARVVS
jgi:hypothetical protein